VEAEVADGGDVSHRRRGAQQPKRVWGAEPTCGISLGPEHRGEVYMGWHDTGGWQKKKQGSDAGGRLEWKPSQRGRVSVRAKAF
jgi:hypothetical protein